MQEYFEFVLQMKLPQDRNWITYMTRASYTDLVEHKKSLLKKGYQIKVLRKHVSFSLVEEDYRGEEYER